MVPWWLAPETEQMDEWARQVPLPSSRHFRVVPLPRTRAELPQDVRELTGVPSVFPQTGPSSLLFPTRGRSCHLVSFLHSWPSSSLPLHPASHLPHLTVSVCSPFTIPSTPSPAVAPANPESASVVLQVSLGSGSCLSHWRLQFPGCPATP